MDILIEKKMMTYSEKCIYSSESERAHGFPKTSKVLIYYKSPLENMILCMTKQITGLTLDIRSKNIRKNSHF